MPRSQAFPLLTPDVLKQFLEQQYELRENALIRNFIKWVRKAAKK